MRYYDLTLTNPKTGAVIKRWSSMPGGSYDPAALNVMFDMPVSVGDLPTGQHSIIVEGVSLQDLTNAQQYATTINGDGTLSGGANLTLKGGMQAGLPLANPAQAGTLVNGAVFQSWGNWIGTDMALSFLVVPPAFRYNAPGNIVFNWQPGQKLSDSITQTLSTAYPQAPLKIEISPQLVAARPDIGYFSTFSQFAQHIKQLTQGLLNASYAGVRMTYSTSTIRVFDGTQPTPIALLKFTDFVGQPTWIAQDKIQVKTVLRGDIQVGDFIEFPIGFQNAPGFVQTGQASYPTFYKYQSAIQGKFAVIQVRHVGNFRDPDGNAWVSIFNCVPAASAN